MLTDALPMIQADTARYRRAVHESAMNVVYGDKTNDCLACQDLLRLCLA